MFNYAQTVAMVQESVTANGREFVYEKQTGEMSCLYIHTTKDGDLEPGCIVGDMLVRQHILTLSGLLDIQEGEGNGKGDVEDIVPYVTSATGHAFTEKALDFLWSLQRRQDNRVPWGLALDGAKEIIDADSSKYCDETEARIPIL